MDKPTIIFDEICTFMNEHEINSVEDIYQRDSVNESCVDLVATLVGLLLEE